MFGLGKHGFKRKKYSDIVESMQNRATDIFGEDINLNNNSFLGMLINVVAWALALVWELGEKIYFNKYVDFAEGNNLDLATRNNAISRRAAYKARGRAVFNGVAPKGLLLSSGDIIFETTEGGTEVEIMALKGGSKGNLPSNAIDEIVTPVPNLELVSVTETVDGLDAETDAQLRLRFFASLSSPGASTYDAIMAALLKTDGVRSANIQEVEEDGYYKSIRAIVLGGSPNNVAQALLDYKAFGIKTIGTENGTGIAKNGDEFILNFDYAAEHKVDISVSVTTDNSYPSNGDDLVRQAVEEYINTLKMGDDVVYSKVIISAFNVKGVMDADIELNSAKNNVAINFDEVAVPNVVVL